MFATKTQIHWIIFGVGHPVLVHGITIGTLPILTIVFVLRLLVRAPIVMIECGCLVVFPGIRLATPVHQQRHRQPPPQPQQHQQPRPRPLIEVRAATGQELTSLVLIMLLQQNVQVMSEHIRLMVLQGTLGLRMIILIIRIKTVVLSTIHVVAAAVALIAIVELAVTTTVRHGRVLMT